MTNDASILTNLVPYNGAIQTAGEGVFLPITHSGDTVLENEKITLKMSHTLLVPGLSQNLLSVPALS